MNAVLAYDLAEQSYMASVERLVTLGWAVECVLRARVPGAVVELGCNAGHTSVWLASCLRDSGADRDGTDGDGPDRELVLFDSFEGLPAPSVEDTIPADADERRRPVAGLTEGDLAATEEQVVDRFTRYGLPVPRIVPGWFADTLHRHLPDPIALAYLDADFYTPTLAGLTAVWPRLAPGGLLVVDDYCDPARDPRGWAGLPGVKRACDAFLAGLGVPSDAMRVVPGVAGWRATGYLIKETETSA